MIRIALIGRFYVSAGRGRNGLQFSFQEIINEALTFHFSLAFPFNSTLEVAKKSTSHEGRISAGIL